MIITVDGQSSSGKSSLAFALADHLGFHFLGSGSTYRLVAYAKLQGKDIFSYIESLEGNLEYVFLDGEMRVVVSGEDLTVKLHDAKVTKMASDIAKEPRVRQALEKVQKSFNRAPGLVAEGRDMGTVVFPEAEFKFFLISDLEVRAKRRLTQLKLEGIERDLQDEIEALRSRDEQDQNRSISPLKPAKDAIIVDTSLGSKEENLQKMLDKIQSN